MSRSRQLSAAYDAQAWEDEGAANEPQPSPQPSPTRDSATNDQQAGTAVRLPGQTRIKINKTAGKGTPDVCHVCGGTGHTAGFSGAIYVDCPAYACYLCKAVGHTTTTCPYRPSTQLVGSHSGMGEGTGISGQKLYRAYYAALPLRDYESATALYDRVSLVRLRAIGDGNTRKCLATAAASPGQSMWRHERAMPAAPQAFSHTAFKQRDSEGSPYCNRWRVVSGVLRMHQRRVTVLSFHPSPAYADVLVSADKSGEIGVWRFAAGGGNLAIPGSGPNRGARHVYGGHKWLVNALDWGIPGHDTAPGLLYSAGSDGTVRVQDLERGKWVEELFDLNPLGWTGSEADWRMFYSIASGSNILNGTATGLVLAGDDMGRVWAADRRTKKLHGCLQAHKKGCKVQSLQYHPLDGNTVASAGNDWTCRIWDLRMTAFPLPSPSWYSNPAFTGSTVVNKGDLPNRSAEAVVTLQHNRVVNNALFSCSTGNKLLTTCIDNRIRIWNNVATLVNDQKADRELVHSHDFARYLSPFRAVWDPKDASERTIVCGRYISEAFDLSKVLGVEEQRGGEARAAAERSTEGRGEALAALHPIDILDAGAARPYTEAALQSKWPAGVVAQLVDPIMSTIAPVNAVHPTCPVIASGTSKNIFLWGMAEAGKEALDVRSSTFLSGVYRRYWSDEGRGEERGEERGGKRNGMTAPSFFDGPTATADNDEASQAVIRRLLGAPTSYGSDDSDGEERGEEGRGGPKKRRRITKKKEAVEAVAAPHTSLVDAPYPVPASASAAAVESSGEERRGEGRGGAMNTSFMSVSSSSAPAAIPDEVMQPSSPIPLSPPRRARVPGGRRGGRRGGAAVSTSPFFPTSPARATLPVGSEAPAAGTRTLPFPSYSPSRPEGSSSAPSLPPPRRSMFNDDDDD